MSDFNKIAYSLLRNAPSKGEKRKVDIINSAIRSINELGIEKTTFESIGKFIGIGKAHVAYHFKKKEDLILAAIELISLNAQKHVEGYMQKASNPQQLLFYYLDAHKVWVDEYREHAVIFTLFFHYSTFDPRYRMMNQQVKDVGHQRIQSLLQAYGVQQKGKDLALLATTVQQLIQSALLDCVTHETSAEKVFTSLKNQLKLML